MPDKNFLDNPIKYIIFDMDGVLIDSEPVSVKAGKTALSEIGIFVEDTAFVPYIGTGEKNFIIGPCTLHGKEDCIDAGIKRFYELFGEYVNSEFKVFESVHRLLDELKKRSLKLAIASSSAAEKLAQSLAAANISKDLFDVIISGDDVTEKKPSPEIYMTAISRLGANPHNCLVVEDAISGVCAAKSALCRCFAVTTSFTKEQLIDAGADFLGSDIIEVLDIL
ncbi:MAG: HAD-IA family hydrolase [Clostridia bacterium]|nr:HAD-IA family hydrolase [Clostridia bacterium]